MPSSGSASRIASAYDACGCTSKSRSSTCSLQRRAAPSPREGALAVVAPSIPLGQRRQRQLRVARRCRRSACVLRPSSSGSTSMLDRPARPPATPDPAAGCSEARADRQDRRRPRQQVACAAERVQRQRVPVRERAAPVARHRRPALERLGQLRAARPTPRPRGRRRRRRSAGARPSPSDFGRLLEQRPGRRACRSGWYGARAARPRPASAARRAESRSRPGAADRVRSWRNASRTRPGISAGRHRPRRPLGDRAQHLQAGRDLVQHRRARRRSGPTGSAR